MLGLLEGLRWNLGDQGRRPLDDGHTCHWLGRAGDFCTGYFPRQGFSRARRLVLGANRPIGDRGAFHVQRRAVGRKRKFWIATARLSAASRVADYRSGVALFVSGMRIGFG